MEITTKARYLRISPRKAQLAADLVRGRQANEALAQLKVANKKSARLISKLLKSALANAKHNYDIAADNLFIKESIKYFLKEYVFKNLQTFFVIFSILNIQT